MSISVDGKSAIVTGAAHGIGRAVARTLIEAGARVMYADMDEPPIERDVAHTDEDNRARSFAGDLRERLTVKNLLAATVEAFDRIDILVNANQLLLETDPLDPDDGSVDILLERNLLSGLRVSQFVAQRMIRQSENDDGTGPAGAIVNLSSIPATKAHPQLLGYSVASAAINQMTRSLALALVRHRIRVNAVAFGNIGGTTLQRARDDAGESRQSVIDHAPMSRAADPSEVARAVLYLTSDAADFVTGQVLTVDGGRSLVDPAALSTH